jgi:NitT/TauT family transport system ATP-binding protein
VNGSFNTSADRRDTGRGVRIEMNGVTIRYDTRSGPVHALGPIDLEIEGGEFVSIVGPSGCGKSTTSKVVSGLLRPSAGHVCVAGEEVSRPPQSMGIVFQDPLLMDWRTVLKNVLLPADMRKSPKQESIATAKALLASAGLAGFEDKRPYELSGGMRQRVAICRALLLEPDLLVMDEPFGALDALTRDRMGLELQRIWMDRGPTVLFITHSISEAVLLSDRIIVMSGRPGTILADYRVETPRPRELADPEHAKYRADLISRVRELLEGGPTDAVGSADAHRTRTAPEAFGEAQARR